MNPRPPTSLEDLTFIDTSPSRGGFTPHESPYILSKTSNNRENPRIIPKGTRLQIRMADTGRQIERGHKTESYITAIEGSHIPSTTTKTTLPKQDIVQREQLIAEDSVVLNSAPLNHRDLDEYRKDPKWIWIRRLLCLLCVIIWLLLLILALYLVLRAPGCSIIVTKWWQGGIIYQLWVPSFQDSNHDGYGDLEGLSNRLSELKRIGVTAVFPRSLIWTEESGHGVLDYKKVAENIGGLDKAKKLIDDIHNKDLKIIIDIPVVATSDQHEWFQRSSKGSLPENAKYSNYYYWKRNVEPSSYVDHYKNSSVLYFHIKDRPDLPILNWKNNNVSNSVKDAISFWIDQNVDGFHLGFVEHLARTPDGQSADWPEIIRILKDIRDHVDSYVNESTVTNGKEIFLIASPEPIKEEEKRKLQVEAGLDAIVNTETLNIARSNKICYERENNVAGCYNEILSDLLTFHAYDGVYPVWELGNAFTSRLATRVKTRSHSELMMLIHMLLPGTSMVYYGEELGLRDIESTPYPQRGAMQWDDTVNGGFTSSEIAKVPVSSSAKNINYENQIDDSHSQLRMFKTLANLRKKNKVLINGQTYISKAFNNAFTICRFEQINNSTCGKVYIGAVNFGKRQITHSLADIPPIFQKKKDIEGHVIAFSSNSRNWDVQQKVDLSQAQIELGPEEGVVFYFKV